MKMFSKEYFKQLWKVLLATFSGFGEDKGLKLSASLAYYTVFSLAPLLILVVSLAGFLLPDLQDASNPNSLYPEIEQYIGKDAVTQIRETIENRDIADKKGVGLVIGIATLLLGASTIFIEIQDSLNMIWRVKAKPKKGWLQMLRNRFLSFSLIVSLGFLLMVSLLINFIISALSDQIEKLINYLVRNQGISDFVSGTLLYVVNFGVTLLIISVLFGIIFKVLPDVKIRWKDVKAGALFTALLFMLGQYVISLYLTYTAQGSAYGAAGSIIVILVWIYYTAAILYIGAEFTQVYAEAQGGHIKPASYAVYVKQTEVESRVREMPAQNPDLEGTLNCDNEENKDHPDCIDDKKTKA